MRPLWIGYILLTLFALIFLIFALIYLRPYDTTTIVNINTLQKAYDTGDGTLDVQFVTNPFLINTRSKGIIYDAVTFSNASGTAQVFVPFLVGNDFKVTQPCEVVSLQIVYDFLATTTQETTRQVAIFNKETGVMIATASVGTPDPVINGFYTHRLSTSSSSAPVKLDVNVLYGIYTLIIAPDSFARDLDITQSIPVVNVLNGSVTQTDVMQIPPITDILPARKSIQFASFQFVLSPPIQAVFEVDVRSTYATFPPNYLYNLNVQVKDQTVEIEPGLCMSGMQNNNMLNNTIGNLKITTDFVRPNGLDRGVLEQDTWYAVYLLTSTVQGQAPAGLLSKNRQQPSVLPVGYESSRRVGWARTLPVLQLDNALAQQFFTMTQLGNGVQRLSTYPTPPLFYSKLFTAQEIRDRTFVPLDLTLASPTATTVALRLVVDNTFNGSTLDIMFREVGATTNLMTVVAGAFVSSTLSATIPIVDFYSPHRLEFGLANTQYEIGSDVQVSVSIESFYDTI